MPVVVIDVMPKPELLDPQGKAVTAALQRLGYASLGDVRQGKRFEIAVDAVTPDVVEAARRAATDVLSNPVIEDVVRVEGLDSSASGSPSA